MFHPVVASWFERRFARPTAVQERAWPLIASGQDVLLTAPTGSGKTLAAFLAALDSLTRQAIAGTLADQTQILYVTPLKALSNDVRRNLEEPLAEIMAAAKAAGHQSTPLRAAVRTGDTSLAERRAVVRNPPHILVTTPESLFILLTSESGRQGLRHVRTVIVDEIHALAADKRGAHLALSLERLDHLLGGRLQRIGLSATVHPMEVASRLLCGDRPVPALVDASAQRELDLAIEVLEDELGAVCTNEQWTEIYDRLATLAGQHRSTIIFVNTRRLVERVALHLGQRLGAEAVAAHHGSLSRARRFDAEQRLKSGSLKAIVATASLELGIDVGAVDLVCMVGSARSIATGMQRVGRSGHAVGGTPKGRFFPLTRDQLVENAALCRAARRGVLDRIGLRDAPLDVLAQQLVAACACEEWTEDGLYALVKRAAPYHALTRELFDSVVEMMSDGIATSRGRSGALLHRDGVNRVLRGRRGARLAAITSGGAIPDTAAFDVVLEPEATVIGTVDEDFAIESMSGDVFLLGNNSWRVRRVENGRVRVEDARGAAPTIPFWLGESPGRTPELSAEVGSLREEIVERCRNDDPDAVLAWLQSTCALGRAGAILVRDYVRAGHASLGAVPSQTCVIAERFFDESGGMQLVLHAPFGGRINRAWGMALRKRFCRSFDFELQAAATDDGIILSLGPQHSFPLETIFDLLRAEDVNEVLTQAVLQAPMFETRWRWNATRALALLRRRAGKKIPPNLQRMRAQDLMTAVFPGQTACQDNHGGGAIEVPDHPLVSETVRDCLIEATDAEGLVAVLHELHAGRIRRVARDVAEPSLFSHEILNANPYAFLDDAPLEERRTRAVSVRRGLPAELADSIGALDLDAVKAVVDDAIPSAANPDELHDTLLELGAVAEPWAVALGFTAHFEHLMGARRATRLLVGERTFWVAAERVGLAELAWPEGRFTPPLAAHVPRKAPPWIDHETAVAELTRAHLGLTGPITATALAAQLALSPSDVECGLAQAELHGSALRGRFLPDPSADGEIEWCDRRLLARIHRRTIERLRREIEPVPVSDFIRFLCDWQHVRPGTQLVGREGLRAIIEQLQGFEAAAGAWEQDLLLSRLVDYEPAWLDELCLGGELTWGRFECRSEGTQSPSRAAPIGIGLRSDLGWLLGPRPVDDGGNGDAQLGLCQELSTKARDVLTFLQTRGASFLEDIVHGARRLRAEVEEALWELVAAGRVTADGFAALRALLPTPGGGGTGARRRWYGKWTRQRAGVGAGRWALLLPPAPLESWGADEPGRAAISATEPAVAPTPMVDPALIEEDRLEALARQYVRRWGVVFRELLRREPHAPPWRDLVRVYRRLELRGELRGGRLVAGVVGEQFASGGAVEALRAVRRHPGNGDVIALSACDPLNLVGILTPGPRISTTLANTVVFRDGVPVDETGETAGAAVAAALPWLPATGASAAISPETPGRGPATTQSPRLLRA
jgi:ATP-dependent Lhr-like helicase